jgi:two-component system cell cycle sensor histidine kinase/response regulator CckA
MKPKPLKKSSPFAVVVNAVEKVRTILKKRQSQNHLRVQDMIETRTRELRESEERYRAVFTGTPDGIIIHDAEGCILDANEATAQRLEIPRKALLGRNIAEFITPESAAKMGNNARITLAGQTHVFETTYVSASGKTIPAEVNECRIHWRKVQAVLSISRNITERKQAEEALQKSEEKFRLITENMLDCVALVDASGAYQYATPSYRETLGYGQGEIIGIKGFSLIHPEDLERVFNLYMEGIEQGLREINYETRLHHKNGHYVPVELRVRSLNDPQGKIIGGILAARDITKRLQIEQGRKRAEEALRKSEERFRSMIQSLSDIIFILDGNGQLTYESPSATRILGYQPGYFIGKSPFTHIHPDDLDQIMKAMDEVFGSVNPGIPTEFRYRKVDGTWINLEALGNNQFENPGIQGIVLTVRDITERKRAEEEKKVLQERLQQVDKMESIGTLAGGIAHNFNNLLMGIQGYASMALMHLDPSNPNYERLKRIEQQVQSGAELTSQLLGFARGGRYEVKPMDMNEILEKTSSMFGRTKKEISVHRKSGKDLWSVEVDRGQMEQVFLNLYVNAWQAMPGGGEIYLETQNVLLNGEQALFYSVNPGKYVKISITDTGTGMDEKTKERIFDPFFTTKDMGRGTGLGLATVYGIIKGHQGMINVYSEPDHGTTFTIYLPASEKEVIQEKTATGEIARGTETILLVDDEKMVLEVNKELLASMGYKVHAVGSGQEAIAVYTEKRNKIDLIILDMIMPGISGSDTFDRLREINPEIKVLLSSGYSLNGQAQSIMDRGCNGFLQKPFNLEQLASKVRETLD